MPANIIYVMLLPASYAGEYYLWTVVQVPRETLETAGMLINFRSGKFGYSICPIFSKGHAKIICEILHDFAKNRTYGVS